MRGKPRKTSTSKKSKSKLAELEVQNKVTSMPLSDENKGQLVPPDEYVVLKDIWSRLKSNEISLEHAKIGETFSTGRIIYDYDLIIEILISAGYSIKYALKFIDSMVEGLDDEAPFPIVAITKAKLDIMGSIQKLPGAQEAMNKANFILEQQAKLSKNVE